VKRSFRLRRRVLVLLAALAALGLLAMAALALALEDAPRVPQPVAVSAVDIERALHVMRRHDPRRQRPGEFRVLALEQRDLQLLLVHAASRLAGFRGQVSLEAGQARGQFSLPAPAGPLSGPLSGLLAGRWLNVEVTLEPEGALVRASELRVGRLRLPAALAWPVAQRVAQQRLAVSDLGFVENVVKRIDLRAGRVLVFYLWQDDTASRLLSAVVPPEDQARLIFFTQAIAERARRLPADQGVPLPLLLAPAFADAQARSTDEASAAAENRAALMALTLFGLHQPPTRLVPSAKPWPVDSLRVLHLQGRDDLPLHWLISAWLAAESGRPLADAVGAYKEMADTRSGGSGFSFSDLLADRVGTQMGRLAVEDATRTQARLARVRAEAELLPPVTGLADNLSAEEFTRRFGGVGAPAYLEALQELERRVASTPVLRP
jgi:hypothetical protein